MNFNEFLNIIKDLSRYSRFYGKLLSAIEELKTNDTEKYKNFIDTIEKQNFKDSIDVVLYFES